MTGQVGLTDEQLLWIILSGFKSGAMTALANFTGASLKQAHETAQAVTSISALDPATREQLLETARAATTVTPDDIATPRTLDQVTALHIDIDAVVEAVSRRGE